MNIKHFTQSKLPILPIFIILAALLQLNTACTDQVNFTESTDAKLDFSTDTIQFDTIFTTVGSATQNFRFYNRNTDAVRTTIRLSGGDASQYNINIDGQPVSSLDGFELLAGDSAFVFVEVTIDPLNQNAPLIVRDSIQFITNGNVQDIKLVAYGQDVHLIKDSLLNTQTWVNDKPYLITHYAYVPKEATLTIDQGVKLHFNTNSSLWIDGTLLVNGTFENPVVFEGARNEEGYADVPSQWGRSIEMDNGIPYLTGGIHFFSGSGNNVINYAIIKNAIKGIQVDSIKNPNETVLTIANTVIKNMSLAGIYAQSTNLDVYNSIISNCGYYAVALSLGGNYRFYHNTIANYYSLGGRKTESLVFKNYFEYEDSTYSYPFQALFGNCIIDGDYKNEFAYDATNANNVTFAFKFDHCYLKLSKEFNTSDTSIYAGVLRASSNNYCKFVNYKNNYMLDTLSPAKDTGNMVYSNIIPIDYKLDSRTTDGKPDLGAYERIEAK